MTQSAESDARCDRGCIYDGSTAIQHSSACVARWEAHIASVYQTAMGWRWGCSCGKAGRGVGTPTAPGAWAAANRHVSAARRVTPTH